MKQATILNFSKMHANGNDFVFLNGINQNIDLNVTQRRQICDRNYGIGCDQILLVLPPNDRESDFYCKIFNADGSESGQCGNGMCCLAQFIHAQMLSGQTELKIQTSTTRITLTIDENRVRAMLGIPEFTPQSIPFKHNGETSPYAIDCLGQQHSVTLAHVGNGHAIIETNNLQAVPVKEWGHALSTHKRFPKGVNVSFVSYISNTKIALRIFERGAGETLACGSAAAAAAANGLKHNRLQGTTSVQMPGGTIQVSWPNANQPISIETKVNNVFAGCYTL